MNKKSLIFFLISARLLFIDGQVIAQISDYKKAVNAYNRGDYKIAHKLIRPLANNGFPQAQYSLGVMYESGKGVDASLEKAKKWFQLAAEKGISKAQFKLGLIYRDGKDGEKNYSKAVEWWKLAANKGNVEAQTSLGAMFENGQGIPQDYAEAIRLYELAAEAGNVRAQKYLNLLLNKKVDAQINLGLGIRFETGQGVVQDYNEAMRWYSLAADLGSEEGKEKLGLLVSKMQNLKEIPAVAKHLINLGEKKEKRVVDLETIQPGLRSAKSQIKPDKTKENKTANLSGVNIDQRQLQNAADISIPMDEFAVDRYRVNKIAKGDNLINVKINTSKLECNPLNNTIQTPQCAKLVPKGSIKEKNNDHFILQKKATPSSIRIKQTSNRDNKDIFSEGFFQGYLKKWVRAWENQDLQSYFSFYARNFKGLKNKHLDWKDSRRLALEKHTNISIELNNIKIFQKNDVAKTNFTQIFKSDNYSDIGIKELFWVRYGADWRITSETWLPIRK